MKAVVLTDIRKFEIVELPDPRIQSGNDVLVRVERVGVCGSDIHYYRTGRIGSQVVEFPFIVGHECAGTVAAVGDKVTRVKVGDRVAVDPAVPCHRCDQCLSGRENTCRKLKFLGCPGQLAGSLCEYLVMPEDSCFAANEITLDQSVLTEPLAISLYAIQQAKLLPSADIAVLGCGPIGLGCIVCSRIERPNSVCATEIIPERLDSAIKAGANFVFNPNQTYIVDQIHNQMPYGVDAVFECAGKQETLDQAVEILKPGGKLLMIGIPEFDTAKFRIEQLRRKELTLINVRRQNRCTGKCVELIANGSLNADFMVTHHFDLDQTAEAFEMVSQYRNGVIKAMIHI